jgi:hypothetical protein
MSELPDLSLLSDAEKDALIRALWGALQASERRNAELAIRLSAAERRIAELAARLNEPPIKPLVTRVERYAGHCPCCGATTLAAVPEGMEAGTPFSLNLVALAIYLRVIHAVSYRRLSRLFSELFGLAISEGALDAAFRRAKPGFDAERRSCSAPSCWRGAIAPSRTQQDAPGGGASTMTSMPSWRSPRLTAMADDCADDTACFVIISSPSSTTRTSPRTTTAPSANSGPPRHIARSPEDSDPPGAPISSPTSDPSSGPPPGTASTPTPPSKTPSPQHHCRSRPYRVEQIPVDGVIVPPEGRPLALFVGTSEAKVLEAMLLWAEVRSGRTRDAKEPLNSASFYPLDLSGERRLTARGWVWLPGAWNSR